MSESPAGLPEPAPGVPASAPPALAMRGLYKRFGSTIAVAGLDLDIPSGSFYGIVGPNGAGKTTNHSMAPCLLTPDLGAAGGTLVADYSAGMTKKITLACALVHAPSVLVLDEPFEAVDPISAQGIRRILRTFVDVGGTVVMSSHVMSLVEQVCDRVAVVAAGRVIAAGTLDEVRSGMGLERRFVDLLGLEDINQDLSWLRPSSD